MNLVLYPPGIFAMSADEISTSSLKAPVGFQVELWASGMPNAHSIVPTPSGTLYVSTRFPGSVYAVVEKDGKREVKVINKGLHRSNGVAFKDDSLRVAELSRIIRDDNSEANLDKPPALAIVFDALPKDEAHGCKFMRLSPDGNYLYFQIGTPANITLQPVTHAVIVRLNLKTNTLETVAQGVRNSVGMDFHSVTNELWFTNKFSFATNNAKATLCRPLPRRMTCVTCVTSLHNIGACQPHRHILLVMCCWSSVNSRSRSSSNARPAMVRR
jgi:glucose/arabinose dehydrogenase